MRRRSLPLALAAFLPLLAPCGCSEADPSPAPSADSAVLEDSTGPDTNVEPSETGSGDSAIVDTAIADTATVDTATDAPATADSGAVDSTATDSTATDSGAVDSTVMDSTATDSWDVDSTADASAPVDSGAVDSTVTDSIATDSAATDSALDAPAEVTFVPADRCTAAGVLTPGTTVADTTADATDDYGVGLNCVGTGGPDKAWSITVPVGKRLVASVTSASSAFNPSINLVAGPASACSAAPRVCVAGDDSGTLTTTNTVRTVNELAAGQELFVIVDSASTTGGPFSLSAALEDVAAGDACATAEAITADGVRPSETLVGYVSDYAGGAGCAVSAGGPDRVYSVELPTGKELVAQVVAGATQYALSLVVGPAARCGAGRSCVASDASTSTTKTTRYRNYSGGTQTVFIVVDSPTGGIAGTFSLSTSRVDAPLLAAGELCANARPLSLSTTATTTTGTLLGYSRDYALASTTGCKASSGPEVAYAVSIPAGTKLVAKVTPAGGMDTVLNLVLGDALACLASGTICAAGADALGPVTDQLEYTNTSGATASGFLLLSSYGAASVSTYSLEVQLQ